MGSPLQVDKILYALDKDDSGTVEWTEFIAAALCVSVCGEKRLTAMAFAMFDRENKGKASAADLLEIFGPLAGDERQRNLWQKSLPSEIAKVAKGSTTFTTDQFDKYMGQKMRTLGGEQLSQT